MQKVGAQKCSGVNNNCLLCIAALLFFHGVEEVMTEICNRVLAGGNMPEDWRDSLLVPLCRGKGNVTDCGAHRGMKFSKHGKVIVERVFERIIRKLVEVYALYCGFMPGMKTIDALLMVKMSQEQCDRKKKLYISFVALEKPLDRIPRGVIR
jgi:hypothetical protein